MPFELVAEMTDGCRYRPGRRVSQRTDRIPFYFTLNVPQQVYVAHLAFSIFNVVQNLFHPARSFTAWRALATAFMPVKPRQRQGVAHHALVFVQHNETAGAHHGTGLETAIGQ